MQLNQKVEPRFYLYKTLGLPNSATSTEITEAYKKHIVKHHPDNYPAASDVIKPIQHAYEVLSNKETRDIYDMFCRLILYSSDSGALTDERQMIMYPKPSWVAQKNDVVYIMDMSLRNMYAGKQSTVVTKEISVEVDIQNGTRDGQRITYKGKGRKPRDRPPGDLIVIINRIEYPFFQQRKSDIFCTIEVDNKIVNEGGQLCIRHPSGNIVTFEVDPGEIRGPGMQKVLENKGQHSSDKKKTGDMHIEFKIFFPYANVTI